MILDDVVRQVGRQVEAWRWELAGWLEQVAGVFARPEPRLLLEQMTIGLLSPLPKKNGWTLAESAGHTHPGRIQTFLCRGAWEASALEARVRDLVVQVLGDERGGVLIVDDTQIIKKGTKSVGVAPQHCGATNQIENCQVIVMSAYARVDDPAAIDLRSDEPIDGHGDGPIDGHGDGLIDGRGGGHAFIGHRLYLPERWTSDPDRCREAGIPGDVVFATKPRQAVELFAEADEAGVPFGWIAADGGYGQYREVRDWPTGRSKRYVMAVPSSQPLAGVPAIVGIDGGRGQAGVNRADDLLARATGWQRRSCGHGSKGERFYDWAFFTVALPAEPPAAGFEHTLMIRRSIADPSQVAYFLVHAPRRTATNTMVAVAGIRWRIEECNEQGKDLIGLDQHQVRTWTAFHHHVVVAMFAHAFAATRKALLATPTNGPDAHGEGAHRGNDPAPISPRPPQPTPQPVSPPGRN